MNSSDILAANLRKFRAERGWSQEDLAEYSGLHRTYISGLECGTRNPTLKVLEQLAQAFDTKIAELLQ
jgi:transcriptional regulator with XRE-family HTH domain